MIDSLSDLVFALRSIDLDGRETIRFRIDGFKSVVTRQMLELRLRCQPQAFGIGAEHIGTSIAGDALHLDVDALIAMNDTVAAELAQVDGVLRYLQLVHRAERQVAGEAQAFARAMANGRPTTARFLAYVSASVALQAMGGLRFCMPSDLRERVAAICAEDAEVLLGSERTSLWMQVRLAELALARRRLRSDPACYAAMLRRFQRRWGYLGAEDIDFVAQERREAIEGRIAELCSEPRIAAEVSAIAAARVEEQRRRRRAYDRFARARPDRHLVALTLLARALAAHDDRNRQAKMRMLRDLRDLALRTGDELKIVSLDRLAATCA